MKNNSKQLKQYSEMAIAILGSTQIANAGVVYTNVDPDSVWVANYLGQNIIDSCMFPIDFNNDNITDAEIKGSYWYSSYTSNIAFTLKLDNPKNKVVSQNTLVSKLNQNSSINSNLSWNKTYGQSAYLYNGFFGEFTTDIKGEWIKANKKFIAIKFENNGNYYFGWIRVTTSKSPWEIKIHDYAYNDVPNTPIIAGDTSSITTNIKNVNEKVLNVSAYSFGNKVCINFIQDFTDGNISIVNVMGQEIYKAKLTNKHNQIPINANAGEYFINIQTNEGSFNKKVFIGD